MCITLFQQFLLYIVVIEKGSVISKLLMKKIYTSEWKKEMCISSKKNKIHGLISFFLSMFLYIWIYRFSFMENELNSLFHIYETQQIQNNMTKRMIALFLEWRIRSEDYNKLFYMQFFIYYVQLFWLFLLVTVIRNQH